VRTLAGEEIIVPRHKLATAWNPDSIRHWARDGRVDYDTFHDRESMYKLKSDGIEDDGRERNHDEPRAKRRESQGGIASSTQPL
jgi:hypothetical protein